jgi:cell division inhibitor SepF
MANFIRGMMGSISDEDTHEGKYEMDEATDRDERSRWWSKIFSRKERGNIVPFPSGKRGGVYLLVVNTLEDAKKAADLIKSGVAVVANLQLIERRHAQRIVDVLSGVCYALDGTFMRFGDRLFLFAPPTIPASGDEQCLREINQLFIKGIANGVEGLSDRAFGQGRLIGRERQGESET